MSQILSSPSDCCRPCPEPLTTTIPGVPGQNGTNGTNGAAGQPAWTATTADFMMPAEGGSVTVQLAFNDFIVIGEIIAVGDQGSATFGYFRATNKPNATSVDLTNLANTASSLYLTNSAVGTTFPAGSVVGAGGLQGPNGTPAAGAAPDNATYITQTPNGTLSAEQALSALGTGFMFSTTATGVVSTVAKGILASNVAPVDAGAALTAGELVQVVAGGLKSDTAANTRTLLGLGNMAVQAKTAVDITGGTIAGVAISTSTGAFTTLSVNTNWSLTPSGLQTLAAANLIAYAPKIRVVGNGGPVTMTSTPTLALGTVDGQEILIQGTHDTNTITLQDNGSLAGSKLRLGAASRVLGAGDTMRASWDATLAMWVETSYTNLV